MNSRKRPGRVLQALPSSGRLDIATLACVFNDCTNSYKYFFFLALLERVERAGGAGYPDLDRPMPLAELSVDMVLAAWYPHGFCRLSLGVQDRLQTAVDQVAWGPIRGSWIVAGGSQWKELRRRCAEQLEVSRLVRYVPYRLIRPFFFDELRGVTDSDLHNHIYRLSRERFSERCPFYCFTEDRSALVLHHEWLAYFREYAEILRGWARFELARYLEARNPSIGGIVEKLAPPVTRASLARQTAWWREALPLIGEQARCIYTGTELCADDLSLDHYLPWSFVAHDRLWNLVPVAKQVNSAKSDHIPDSRYRHSLVGLQHAAIVALRTKLKESQWTKSVEPWLIDLSITKEGLLDKHKLEVAYDALYTPLESLAARQGFATSWKSCANPAT